VRERLKAPARRLLRRAGLTLFRERPPGDLANPLPVELAAHRLLTRALLERLRIDCVVDVGAHRGEFAGGLRNGGYRGAIVSFEPVAASFAALEARAAGDPAWDTRRLALGAAPGRARMRVARETNFSSFLAPTRFSVDLFGGSEVEREEEVEVARLDAALAGLDAERVLLKTDTQGSDLEVIAGAGPLLDRVVALQVELSLRPLYEGATGWRDALGELDALGFRPAHLTTVARDAGLGIVELDCLLVRTP
jgi:FkbM family methyltransferase